MIYKVDGWNNFCRVFRLPQKFSSQFCFGGGIQHVFIMEDWFYPVPEVNIAGVSKEVWEREVGKIIPKEVSHEEIMDSLIPFLKEKNYYSKDWKYLVICDFGCAFTF